MCVNITGGEELDAPRYRPACPSPFTEDLSVVSGTCLSLLRLFASARDGSECEWEERNDLWQMVNRRVERGGFLPFFQ